MTGKGIQIVSTGRALPKKRIDNEYLCTLVDTSDEWIRSRTGIGNRYQCEEESCVSLAVEAAKKALENADGVSKEEIGAVIVATSTGDYAFPSVACLVQKELDLPEEVMAFDVCAACTGFLMGLGTIRGLLQSMNKKYALLVGSEQLTKVVDYTDRGTCILFGDGAGAVVIANAPENLYVQKSWSRGNVEVLNCLGAGSEPSVLHMKGNEVFRFAVIALEQAIRETLKEASLSMEDVDHIICHQANERIIRHVQRRFPGQEEKFYMNIAEYGNTSAASIPIALDEMREKGICKSGERVLFAGFGAGLTWSSAVLDI